MLKTLITVIIFLFYVSSSVAQPKEEQLTFLPKGAKRSYKKDGRIIFKPLTEFKIGKKYCLHSSPNWDEACQDAAMKYAYGENWQEFKRVILAFIDEAKNDKVEEMLELVSENFQIVIDAVRGDGYRGRRAYDKELYSIRSLIEDSAERIGVILAEKDKNYTDFVIKDFWKDSWYNITINKYLTILFDYRCVGENCKTRENIPKILGAYYFIDD